HAQDDLQRLINSNTHGTHHTVRFNDPIITGVDEPIHGIPPSSNSSSIHVGSSASTSAGIEDRDFSMGSIYSGPEDDLPVPSLMEFVDQPGHFPRHSIWGQRRNAPELHPGHCGQYSCVAHPFKLIGVNGGCRNDRIVDAALDILVVCTPSTSKPTSLMSEQELLRMSKSILRINSLDDNANILELERPFHTAFADNTDKLHWATKDLRQMEKAEVMNLKLSHMLDRFITQVQDDWHTQQGMKLQSLEAYIIPVESSCFDYHSPVKESLKHTSSQQRSPSKHTSSEISIPIDADNPVKESVEAYIIPGNEESLEAYIIQDKYLP
ncbi:uncharacterized protein EDB91DRAFT_1088084, partial [Suillus paluster]|uniref:uncharacterized protein n=1 Tax=Suillus paluster TaxID=48578 RepID=UPI001B86D782